MFRDQINPVYDSIGAFHIFFILSHTAYTVISHPIQT